MISGRMILIALLCIALHIPTTADAESAYYESIREFLKENLPGEAFLPTPYGADSRYQPKSIWIYLRDYQNSSRRIRRTNAWVIASSGAAVFDGVQTYSQPINLPVRESDKKRKLELAAALNGTVSGENFEAELDALLSSGADIDVDFGEVTIEYVNYFDLLMAQNRNQSVIEDLESLLTARYGQSSPPQRVITAALKVKDATFRVKSTDAAGFGVGVRAFLSSLGFKFNAERNEFDVLTFTDWRYIAYQAKYSDEFGLISSGEDPEIDDSGAANISIWENPAWDY